MHIQHAVNATEDVVTPRDVTLETDVQQQQQHLHCCNTSDANGSAAQTLEHPRSRRERRSSVEVTSKRDILESSEELLFLEVRPPLFAAIWIGMIAIHVFCGTVLALQAQLYIYMASPAMSYYVHLIKPNIARKYPASAAVFGVLSALHWTVVLQLCRHSLQQRTLAFFPAGHYDPPHRTTTHDTSRSNDKHIVQTTWTTRLQARIHSVSIACFSRRGVFGVESRFFYVYFYVRECLELTSQIYQAYRASMLVAQPWLNHLLVAVIVVNCFSTPIVQVVYKRQLALRRIYLLAIDAVLDFVVALLVPLSIFLPYAQAFDTTTQTFATEQLYDHKWFSNAVLENQEVFVVSTLDLCFKIIPHLSIRGCLKKVRALVRKDTTVVPTASGAVVRAVDDPIDETTNRQKPKLYTSASERSLRFQAKVDEFHARQRLAKAQAAADALAAHTASGTQQTLYQTVANALKRTTQRNSQLVHKYAGKLVRTLFLFVGVAIVLLHGFAFRTSFVGDKRGCWQTLRPWFTTQLACSVYEVDCDRLGGIAGNASQVDAALRKLDANSVVALLFTHCQGLEIPPRVRDYSHLLSLDVYNSTLRAWPTTASLTQQTNPVARSVSFVRVNFTDGVLPVGITSADGPDGLLDIELSMTNLIDLPLDLDVKWPHMTKLLVEHSQLAHWPATFKRLRVDKLSLEGNSGITALPDDLFSDDTAIGGQRYAILALSKTSLQALPVTASDRTTIESLHVHNTNLSVLPDWVTDKLATGAITRVYAHNTPFCMHKTAENILVSHGVGAPITCVTADPLNDIDGLYPLTFIDKLLTAATTNDRLEA